MREYVGRPEELADTLFRFGMIWVLGGNAFLSMRAMRQSGFTQIASELLRADSIAYCGFSAGAIAATPHLRGLDLMDDPFQLADHYDSEVVWDAMGLVPFSIVPHHESDHPDARLAERTVRYMKKHGIPHLAMRDGDVYVFRDRRGLLYSRNSSSPGTGAG